MTETLYIVMSNPPETKASYPLEVWDDEETAEERADKIPFGYTRHRELNAENDL